MSRLLLSAGILAAFAIAGAAPARAADLDYRGPADRWSSAYEDPRYADIYGPPPHHYGGPLAGYDRPAPPPIPPGYVYRDRGYDPYAPRYTELPRPPLPYREGCLPKAEIKHRLLADGWRDFHDLERVGDIAEVNARRPNGDLYFLRIDRCTGDIVSSRLLERGYGPYAHDGASRWGRPYY
jgi:hypothetical protein